MPRYRLSGLRLRVPGAADAPLVARTLGVPQRDVSALSVVRRSLDARRRPALFWELTLELDLPAPPPSSPEPPLVLEEAPVSARPGPLLPRAPLRKRVAVVGTGPAGLFAGLALADAGMDVVLLERGDSAEERYRTVSRFWNGGELDPESNVQFGEGGAGTFSDGKLSCGKRLEKIAVVLETFHRFGAPDSILVDAKPHIGTDRLVVVLGGVRRHLAERGALIRYRSKVVDLLREKANGPLRALLLESGDEVVVDAAVLALGHSARDTAEMLQGRGISLSPKPFAMGVRVEHPQDLIDGIQYGVPSTSCGVPPADYRMAHLASSGRGVYTFCMCPGGEVIACSSELSGVVTNGMSRYRRGSGLANAGIVVQTHPSDLEAFPGPPALRGFAFQRSVERLAFELAGGTYAAPALRVTDFLRGRKAPGDPRPLPRASYRPAAVPRSLDSLYPSVYLDAIAEALVAFDRKMKGFVSDEAVLLGPETRTSSPFRIDRNAGCESPSLPGLFPAGEGAGFAGGIVSAALDGLRVARAVVAKLTGEPVLDASAPLSVEPEA